VVNLRWFADSRASALHAAGLLIDGRRLVDARLAGALAEPAERLRLALLAAELCPQEFFRHAIPLACQTQETPAGDSLVRLAAMAVLGAEPPAEVVAPQAIALSELLAAQEAVYPDLAGQLQVRGAPLAEQWEARGPGLLAAIGRMTDRGLLVQQADVALVFPALGGGGEASPAYNLVRIEAVLANPHAQLPEVVRLGWLIAQLNFDQLVSTEGDETKSLKRKRQLAGLALAPAALAAAEYVELARADLPTLTLALTAWRLVDETAGEQTAANLAEQLSAWWQVARDKTRNWSEAIVELAQRIAN